MHKIWLISFILAIFLPSICFAQSQELTDKLVKEAEKFAKQEQFLEAAELFLKSAAAEKASPKPRLDDLAGELGWAGFCYFNVGEYDKAIKYFKQALQIDRKLKNEAEVASILNNIGQVYQARGHYTKAIEQYRQALIIDRKLGRKAGIAICLNNIGQVYQSRGQYASAIEYFQKALLIEIKLEREASVAICLNNIGTVYESWGQYDKAINYYLQSIAVNKKIGSDDQVAINLSNISMIYYHKGQYGRAIDKFSQALQIAKKLDRKDLVATCLNNIGTVYDSWGKYKRAFDYYQQALVINKKLGRKADISKTITLIGGVYYSWGKYTKAINYYQQALAFDRKLGREADVAINLRNIGHVYLAWGQYEKALDYYQQALVINRELDRETEVAGDLSSIGDVYEAWGQYDKAINYYQQALAIDRKLGREADIASDLSSIGDVYEPWGQYDKALNYYQQALAIDRKLGREADIASDLNNIGSVYRLWKKYDTTIKYYHQALAINKKLKREAYTAITLSNIGQVHEAWGQYDKAIDHYLQALEINKKLGLTSGIAANINNIGGIYSSIGQYDIAVDYYHQALLINKKLKRETDIATILSNIGIAYAYWGLYGKAIDYLQNSIKYKEKLRKTAPGIIRRDYLASHLDTYQALSIVYHRTNNPQGVFESIEQSRARHLADRINNINYKLELPELNTIQNGLAKDEAVLLFTNIDQDDFIIMVITNEDVMVKEVSKEIYLGQVKNKYKKTVLTMLDSKLALPYKNTSKKDEALALTGRKDVHKSDFNRSINYYRLALTSSSSHYKEFSNDLYDLLIKPVAHKLEGKIRLTIIPDGILAFLPFETLIDDHGRHLVEQFDLTYSQSMTISRMLAKRNYPADRKPMLAFGGAVYDPISYSNEMVQNSAQMAALQKSTLVSLNQNRSLRTAYVMLGKAKWGNLPGTLDEVTDIAKQVKGTKVISGAMVTENKVKHLSQNGQLANYKVLHFATHGLVVPEIPELSAIILSQFKDGEAGEDGYLRMGEIAKLDIKADFVNLSACETGLGKIYGGEGVVGLTQSFLIAGANGLSVSLWQVADDSTAIFMSELYKKVNQQGISYSQAIAETKRGFINGDYGVKWKAPFFWSPFVYYGK